MVNPRAVILSKNNQAIIHQAGSHLECACVHYCAHFSDFTLSTVAPVLVPYERGNAATLFFRRIIHQLGTTTLLEFEYEKTSQNGASNNYRW
jgi:hypothetical protein